MVTALIIFLITYIFIGLRQVPRLHIDRTAGALVGAVLMIIFGVVSLDQAFAAIDMNTLLLLLGMMIITVYLRTAGFFELMADKILSLSRTPFQLLVFVTLSSGLLSALFVNDTICLLYTPIILEVTAQLGVNPMPYLLALATSSNVGSVMTVTGNPQNMLISVTSKITYLSFLGALFPVALMGLCVCIAAIRLIYHKEMKAGTILSRPRTPDYLVRKPLLAKSLLVCAGVLSAFSMGYSYALVAVTGAATLLLIGGVRTETILEGVDWTLLLFFSGLFVVMHGVETSGLSGAAISRASDLSIYSPIGRIVGLSAVSTILSNMVSNVPAVMLLKPLIGTLGNDRIAWLALAMSSTLAGNLTLIGSVANLIVVQQARRRVEIGFLEYFRVGALITIITLAIGILVLAIEIRVARCSESSFPGQPVQHLIATVISASPASKTFRIVMLCDTAETRTKGLQGFRKLNIGEAALFAFPKPEAVTFWMGSVVYPIDIVFIDHDKRVIRVYQKCRPGSMKYYPSIQRVSWVLETAAASGIKVGDEVYLEESKVMRPGAMEEK